MNAYLHNAKDTMPCRIESLSTDGYRFTIKQDGELVLQGEYRWTQGLESGTEWRDIPTVIDKNAD